jgi:hypothetical protein
MSGYVKDHKTIIGIVFGAIALGGLLYLLLRKKSGSGSSDGSGGNNITATHKDHGKHKNNDIPPQPHPQSESDNCFVSEKHWNLNCLHLTDDDRLGSQLKCAKYLNDVMSKNMSHMSPKEINDVLSQYPVKYNKPIALENVDYQGLCDEAKNTDPSSNCADEYIPWYNNDANCMPFHQNPMPLPTASATQQDYNQAACNWRHSNPADPSQCQDLCDENYPPWFSILPNPPNSSMCKNACNNNTCS